jgi:predicted nucleic-acid-binding protein
MWLFEQEFRVKGSFADAFIAALRARSGCSRTLTFNLKAARLPGFELA